MAAPGYHVDNTMGGTKQALSSSNITIVRTNVAASSGKRFYIFDIEVGQSAQPNSTDCEVIWSLIQCDATTAGTSTSITPYSPSDTAITVGHGNYTVEPTTYTAGAVYWARAINQRASARWEAGPGGELVIPSTASTGPGLVARSSAYTGTVIGGVRFAEI